MSIYFAAVSLYDSANTIETKTVMALADFPKRLTGPAVGRQVKSALWLLKSKKESILVHPGNRKKRVPITIVTESIGKELCKGFLQKLRINIQHRVADLNVPGDRRALPGKIMIDFLAQVFHQIGRPVRDQIGFDVTDCVRKGL